jgi:tetratricopeptide (TPR) repeat protein
VINILEPFAEQVSNVSPDSVQEANLPHNVGSAKFPALGFHLNQQVEAACCSLALGEFDVAERHFRGLLQIALSESDFLLAEVACHNLATTLRQSGHWLAAQVWQQQSLAWQSRKEVNSSWQSDDELARLASDLTGRGCDAFLNREWDIAESLWRRALAIEEWRGSWEGCAIDSGNLGLLAAACGDLESGIRWLRESLRLHRLMLDDLGIGTDLLNLAELYRLQGKFLRVSRLLRRAAKHFERADALGLLDQVRQRMREAARIEAVLQFDARLN